MTNTNIRNLKINLDTNSSLIAAYLHGYLRGLHDIGRMDNGEVSTFRDKYVWSVKVYDPRITYSHMSVDRITEDLTHVIKVGLEKILTKSQHLDEFYYRVEIKEVE